MRIYLLGVMDKLRSKLQKNENNTGIALNQIYLPKLHENILIHYRSNLFKEIAIVLGHGFQTTLKSPASRFDGLHV